MTRAASPTQQLLAFSRKQHLTGRPINPNVAANAVVGIVEQSFDDAEQGRINRVLKLDRDLQNRQIDPGQLEVALLGVLLDARDATPEGGTITLKTADPGIDSLDGISSAGLPEGDDVSISISISITDTGAGIPKEFLQRVTAPFFTTKEEGEAWPAR